jgi:hypothetical protein
VEAKLLSCLRGKLGGGALKYEAHPQPSSQRDSKLQNKEEEKKS